ncbi:MAG: NAD(P)/FAD-dependent oxidoreductase [Magnetococcales bacterium]|nr:NAD(P)/FAD-dependent oxidoreductase [Magnetococcales bacterium]
MNVTIIGSGFAALAAIHRLRNLDSGRRIGITVIAPQASFTYLPSLIWIPSGLRQKEDITFSLKPFFEWMGVDWHAGSAVGVKDNGRTVITTSGEVQNDALLIASGGQYIRKLPGIDHTLNPCSGVSDVAEFRDRIETMPGGKVVMGFAGNPKEPTAVRGGPMFEFLFGLHTQLRRQGRLKNFDLAFFSPMAEPGKRLGPKAVKGLLHTMKKRQITTHLGHKMVGFGADYVETEGGRIASDLTLFIPGMTGQGWFKNTGLALSDGGFFKADVHGRVEGGERVYVAGDAGSFPGPEWRAKQAHMAELQAVAAINNIYRELKGLPPRATFRTELICIVDTLDSGIWVSRFKKMGLILPPLLPMHWVKILLEWKSVHPYR